MGFDKRGEIFYDFMKKTNPIGLGLVTFNGMEAPIIEEYIRSMKKGEITVFYCSVASLKEIGSTRTQPAYFYIHLLETEKEPKTTV